MLEYNKEFMANTKKNVRSRTETDVNIDRDDLAMLLQKELNKSNKDGSKVSYFLDEGDDPTQVAEWVSTGSSMLDLAISNRPHGGLPTGKFIELSGAEATGKSLFCAQLIAETQRRGGLSVFFDSEFSVSKEFWQALGINVRNVNYVPFVTLEELFTKLELCIGAFRKADKNRLLTVFIDSIAQASIESEMESEHGVTGYNTGKSQIIGKALRKITGLISRQKVLVVFTNQVRYNMNAGPFGEKWIVPGGKALPHASSVRIRFANIGKIKDPKTKDVIGMECQAQVIKNRCGPNYRAAQFEIHYDSGIQDLASWLESLKKYAIVSGDGRGYKYKRLNGEIVEFNSSKFVDLMNTDDELREEIYMAICNNYIMQYRDPNSKIVEDSVKTNDENDDITQNAVKEE
jgi:recombination protein RecA